MDRSHIFASPTEWRFLLAGTCLFSAGVLAGGLWNKRTAHILHSPRTTLLPKLSAAQQSELPYPPDVLPGARDVDTPFGSIRVYEFGPESGRKVLLIHGISTPAIALGGVANTLVENGCRVMLFDLFGRGYSDTPGDLVHDIRLFTAQILLALSSSPLSWTGEGSGKFSLIGYSLGGGIAASFASYFPHMISSLILFAPAGILRPYHISKASHLIYSEGIIPESLLQRLVRKRLRTPMAQPLKPAPSKDDDPQGDRKQIDAAEAADAEATTSSTKLETNSQALLSKDRPHVTIENAVLFQLDTFQGFVHAFMSSIRYAPIRYQHDFWRKYASHLTTWNQQQGTKQKVLIVLGATDPIIIRNEIIEDATEVLGEDNVEFIVHDDAGHDVPITKGREIAEQILDFWKRTEQ